MRCTSSGGCGDGSWCAYALDVAGHHEQAGAWHRWGARTLLGHDARFDQACEAVRHGVVTGAVMMPARFTLDGHEEEPSADDEDEWPNFQTDCYGFWLWALADHVNRGGLLDDTLTAAADLVIRYLLVAGQALCFDCWEEIRATCTLRRRPPWRPASAMPAGCSGTTPRSAPPTR